MGLGCGQGRDGGAGGGGRRLAERGAGVVGRVDGAREWVGVGGGVDGRRMKGGEDG